MRALVVVLVALAVVSTGCVGGGLFEEDPGEVDTPPAPGDLPDEVDARFVVDGEPLDSLTLEVADTPEARARGLMFRENLSDDRGMLFVFGSERRRTFWMKNTLVPLDIVFLDREMRVVDVEHAAPDPGNLSDSDLPRYSSDVPARYVVEVNRGYANETGLSEGDRLELLG